MSKIVNENNEFSIFITQGFICKAYEGSITNLGRGGSDKTATIIGSVLKAKEIKIWSDKDGLLNNDPRFVENTYPLEKITYEEAEELASYGAKIIHPTCIKPAKEAGINVI